jgi:SAM-dependent methyltransferase
LKSVEASWEQDGEAAAAANSDSDAWEQIESEHDRVRDAYARRTAKDPRYSWSSRGHLFIMQQRERATLAFYEKHRGPDLALAEILDVGCGAGYWLREIMKWGASPERIHGVDLLDDRVREAKRLSSREMTISEGSAVELPYEDGRFDLVMQSTVFTSILDQEVRRRAAAEMIRVTKPGGAILWYDYTVNNPSNRDVRAVTRAELLALFPGCDIVTQSTTLAPPLARRIAPVSWVLAQALEAIPLLRTHIIALIRPAAR